MAAVNETKTKKVGVIGTIATIESGVYEKAIKRLIQMLKLLKGVSAVCPLAEEGWWDNDIAYRIAQEYLEP